MCVCVWSRCPGAWGLIQIFFGDFLLGIFHVDTGTSKYTYMYTIPEESRYKGWDFPNPMLFDLEMGFFDHHSYE